MKCFGGIRSLSGFTWDLKIMAVCVRWSVVLVLLFSWIMPIQADGADKLIVKDAAGASTFRVEDDGLVYTGRFYNAQGATPGFWLDETGAGNKSAFFVLDNKWMQVQRRGQGFGEYEASPLFINVGAPSLSFCVESTGYVGLGVSPAYPLHLASGAYVTPGGVWTNASSREYKQNIKELTGDEALDVLKELKPVTFSYKAEKEETHVGFISEDVPELVATKDRKGMSPMDVVAVLTRVVQEQRQVIADLSAKVERLEKHVALQSVAATEGKPEN